MEVEEGIEITCNRLDKLINEKTGPLDKERVNNNKNNDNDRKQNTEVAWKILDNSLNEEIDLDKHKPIRMTAVAM